MERNSNWKEKYKEVNNKNLSTKKEAKLEIKTFYSNPIKPKSPSIRLQKFGPNNLHPISKRITEFSSKDSPDKVQEGQKIREFIEKSFLSSLEIEYKRLKVNTFEVFGLAG